ncbi:PREDICTED: moesin-like [Cyprinodon variegatus]|uniref:moesin-like n=1 Tax=Cyprinodon variegatus TaxID=28743 RepID=UPI0007428984|nr:PREDICTED: moesin-like [Cyprinodon variegatus]
MELRKKSKDDHEEKLIIDLKEKKEQGPKILEAKTKDFIREREKLHKKRVQLEIKAAKTTQEQEEEEKRILRELEQVRQQISEERKRLEDRSCKDQTKRYYAEKALVSAQLREEKVEREMLLQAFEKVNCPHPTSLPPPSLKADASRSMLQLQQEGSEFPKSNLKKALPGRKLQKLLKTLEEEKEAMTSPAVQENEQPQASGFSPHPFLTVRKLHPTRKETPTSKKAV